MTHTVVVWHTWCCSVCGYLKTAFKMRENCQHELFIENKKNTLANSLLMCFSGLPCINNIIILLRFIFYISSSISPPSSVSVFFFSLAVLWSAGRPQRGRQTDRHTFLLLIPPPALSSWAAVFVVVVPVLGPLFHILSFQFNIFTFHDSRNLHLHHPEMMVSSGYFIIFPPPPHLPPNDDGDQRNANAALFLYSNL